MKRNLRHKAYDEIKKKIIFYELKPGEKIFESEIAKKLKMSRTPVREALLMLENEKLLECTDKQGFIVRKLGSNVVTDYFAIRSVIEEFAIPLVVERITASEMKALRRNLADAWRALKTVDMHNIIRYETEFHQILYKAAKSEVFIETISHLVDKFHWLRAIALHAPAGAQESISDHESMLEALEKKNAGELKRLTKLHLQHAQKKFAIMQGLIM
ncbi:MAG: GntR family transcriptional regulator [Deltaproteobacteria bacterium]|nr:GntR family transcriptional regulator [Deltaproteobacteria bacterium]MBW1978722.1 GntR family transcriptional regulator [Deltaproteobacteria bacterium]MBW2045514.1 GntR family transcriptional regulator [Deltaproteobacteria bacterium]MBW2298953.1 GntR family transcriptional regulator [Deltaproteobacteria bacterium]